MACCYIEKQVIIGFGKVMYTHKNIWSALPVLGSCRCLSQAPLFPPQALASSKLQGNPGNLQPGKQPAAAPVSGS